MQTALTIEDIQGWNKSHKLRNRGLVNIYNRDEGDRMYGGFHNLLNFYAFKENSMTALVKLKRIIAGENFLESMKLKEWVCFHEWLGKRMNFFLIDHDADFESSTLEIEGLKIFIELKPFIPIVVFCEVFQILYDELQLHLPENERVFAKPDHYYYSPPDPVPADVRIKEWMTKIFVD